MTFKKIYPQVVEIAGYRAADGTPTEVAARLIDFPTKNTVMTFNHKQCLLDEFVKIIYDRPNCWIDLRGYASKLGQASTNKELSIRRCKNVKDFLIAELRNRGRNIHDNFKIQEGVGEEHSTGGERDNDQWWRAVEIYVYGSKPKILETPPEIEKPPTPPLPTRPTGWTVSGGMGGSGGTIIGVTAGSLFFTHLDTGEKWRSLYAGAGLQKGLSPFPGGSISTDSMPSTEGLIHSWQKISKVEDLTTGPATILGISATGVDLSGYGGSLVLFGVVPPPVLPFATPLGAAWYFYTLIKQKQVLAWAVMGGAQLGSPDIGVSGTVIKFVKDIKQ